MVKHKGGIHVPEASQNCEQSQEHVGWQKNSTALDYTLGICKDNKESYLFYSKRILIYVHQSQRAP